MGSLGETRETYFLPSQWRLDLPIKISSHPAPRMMDEWIPLQSVARAISRGRLDLP